MSKNYALKRFTKIDFLHKVNFKFFLQMITPFRSYIERKGNVIWSDEPDKFSFDVLTEILLSPGDDAPVELFDAFFYVDEMSGENNFDNLYQDALNAGIDFTEYGDLPPTDLALFVWLQNPELLQRLHAGRHITTVRKFETFFGKHAGIPDTSQERITDLEYALNEFFQVKRKGHGTRVFVFYRDDGIWFLIRHGLPMKREATITDEGGSRGLLFRPEIYDVLNFLPGTGELQVHTTTISEKKAYCGLIGVHIFGDRDFFIYSNNTKKFTLEPFCCDWRKSLICSDIDGIESVIPIEIRYVIDAKTNHTETHKADNLFDAIENEKRGLPASCIPNRLSLRVKFTEDKSFRIVTLCTPNTAIFERDSDNTLISLLLKNRGFILNPTGENHDITIQSLNNSIGDIRHQSGSIGILADGNPKRV